MGEVSSRNDVLQVILNNIDEYLSWVEMHRYDPLLPELFICKGLSCDVCHKYLPDSENLCESDELDGLFTAFMVAQVQVYNMECIRLLMLMREKISGFLNS